MLSRGHFNSESLCRLRFISIIHPFVRSFVRLSIHYPSQFIHWASIHLFVYPSIHPSSHSHSLISILALSKMYFNDTYSITHARQREQNWEAASIVKSKNVIVISCLTPSSSFRITFCSCFFFFINFYYSFIIRLHFNSSYIFRSFCHSFAIFEFIYSFWAQHPPSSNCFLFVSSSNGFVTL